MKKGKGDQLKANTVKPKTRATIKLHARYGKNPYKCGVCENRYATKDTYRRHFKLKHNTKEEFRIVQPTYDEEYPPQGNQGENDDKLEVEQISRRSKRKGGPSKRALNVSDEQSGGERSAASEEEQISSQEKSDDENEVDDLWNRDSMSHTAMTEEFMNEQREERPTAPSPTRSPPRKKLKIMLTIKRRKERPGAD